MALGDVIGRPLVNPLEGLGAGVQAGFEIAQGQERLRIANEELALKKDQISSEYLQKGITALSGFSKAKGGSRKMMAELITNYFEKGGVRINPQTAQLLFSDDANVDILATALQAREYADPLQQKAFLMQRLGVDAEELPTMLKQIEVETETSAKLQQAVTLEAAKQGFKTGQMQFEATRKAEETLDEMMTKYGASEPMLQLLQKYSADSNIQKGIYKGYAASIGAPSLFINSNLDKIKNPTKSQRDALSAIQQTLIDAANDYADPAKRSSAIANVAKAKAQFGSILSSQAQQPARQTKAEKGKPLGEKAIESLTTFQEIPRLINDVKEVIKANKSYFGPMTGRAIRLGEQIGFQTTVGATIDGLLTDVKQTVGKLKEGGVLRYEDEKKYERMLPSIKDKPAVALSKADNILRDMNSKVKTFIETNKRAGRDVSQFEDIVRKMVVPPLPSTLVPENKPDKVVFSLSEYRKKHPNLTPSQYDLAKKRAKEQGLEVVE